MSHVTERVVPTDHRPSEIFMGLFWLSIGAAISVLLEVVYLGTWIAGVPVPFTIVLAFFFNLVLCRTAWLWSPRLALVPLGVWLLGYFLMGNMLGSNFRSIALLLFGIAGGVYGCMRASR